MPILERVRLALRISTDAFDRDEISPIIDACEMDLRLAGVEPVSLETPIITRAVILYAKSQFGYSDDSERYWRAYEALKNSLALSGEYGAAGGEQEGGG